MQIKIFSSNGWDDEGIGNTGYELLDTGEGEKLERFGQHTFIRPYEEAVWPKTLKGEWQKADGKFWSSKAGAKAGWQFPPHVRHVGEKWQMSYKGIKFLATPTPFRHLGFFPEQAAHWDFIENSLGKASRVAGKKPLRFLNLFGYTGVASLFALRAGAEVTHVDASKQILKWAKENQELNQDLKNLPMRIIEDDVVKFLEREIKRGNKYDAVIMDPPKFGRGPKGEVWKLEEAMPKLLYLVKRVLSDQPLFVILTSYATDSSSLSLGNALREAMGKYEGKTEQGELCIQEKSVGRFVSLSNTAIWYNSQYGK